MSVDFNCINNCHNLKMFGWLVRSSRNSRPKWAVHQLQAVHKLNSFPPLYKNKKIN